MDILVLVWFSLLSIVFIEPAPYDILFVFILILTIYQNWTLGKIPVNFLRYLDKELVFFLLINVIGLISVTNISAGIRYSLISFYLIMTLVIIKYYLNETGSVSVILKGYFTAAVIALVLGLIPFYTGFWDVFMYGKFRVQGPFKDPNVFGSFFIPIIIIFLEEIRQPRNLNLKLPVKISFIALFCMAVILSFSRSAWLHLGIAGLLYIFFNIKYFTWQVVQRYLTVFFLFIVITGLSLIGTSRTEYFVSRWDFQKYDQDRFSNQAKSLGLNIKFVYIDGKLKIEAITNKLALTNFQKIVGIGPGQFEVVFDYSAHSFPIRAMIENGILGAIFFVVYIFKILVRLTRSVITNNAIETFLPTKVLLAITVGLLVNGIFIDTIHWRHLWLFFALASVQEKVNARKFNA